MGDVVVISGVGKEWDSTKRSQLSRYFRSHQKYDKKLVEDNLIGLSSVLFPYGDIGDDILYLMNSLNNTEVPVEEVLERLKYLVSNIKIFDYIEAARSITTKIAGRKSTRTFLAVNTLIVSAYNYGRLEGSDSSKREVYFSNKPDIVDINVLLDLEIIKRKVPITVVPQFLAMTSSEQKLFKERFKKGEFAEARKNYSKMSLGDFERCYRRVSRGKEEHYACLLFHEVVNGVLPSPDLFNIKDKLSQIMLKAKTLNEYRLEYMLKISMISNLDDNSFTRRKFFINSEGMTLFTPTTKFFTIEKMTLKEVHIEYPYEQRYLDCTYVTKDGFSKTIPIHLDNLQLSVKMVSVKEDAEVIVLLAKWFGLLDELHFHKDVELAEDLGYDTKDKKTELFKEVEDLFWLVIKELDEVVSEGKYQCSYPSDEETIIEEDEMVTKLIELIPNESVSYVDKLLAKEYCMELPEGFKLAKQITTTSEVAI